MEESGVVRHVDSEYRHRESEIEGEVGELVEIVVDNLLLVEWIVFGLDKLSLTLPLYELALVDTLRVAVEHVPVPIELVILHHPSVLVPVFEVDQSEPIQHSFLVVPDMTFEIIEYEHSQSFWYFLLSVSQVVTLLVYLDVLYHVFLLILLLFSFLLTLLIE